MDAVGNTFVPLNRTLKGLSNPMGGTDSEPVVKARSVSRLTESSEE